ncbi:transcriptional regulator [Pandoraea horticolens]|uniref:Transcriptional regulator n=1 Tax=Pandoraea horticolens TaxID=2508298 RepID=A0A5E4UT18_9BURK|nr:transcriptional regulator [Pandoraea horticolens]
MVVLDLLGRRTALRILWELRGGPMTFRALQEACETNARLLNTRLTELKASRLVEHGEGGYRLSAEGKRLRTALQPLQGWAKQWAARDQAGFDAADHEKPD